MFATFYEVSYLVYRHILRLRNDAVLVPAETSLPRLLMKAQDGDVASQAQVARIYLLARGDASSERKGLRWLRQAAEAGNADAQLQLSLLYRQGALVPKNIGVAERWLQRAAHSGSREAKDKLMLEARESAESQQRELFRQRLKEQEQNKHFRG